MNEQRFYQLYEQLASATANVGNEPNIPLIESLLNEISAMFRLSKGVTRFYRSPADEKADRGETLISYDTGKKGKPVHTVRFETRLMSITELTVYMSDDEEPLSDEEFAKVDLTMRTVLAYISRNRLQDIAEELAFYDDSGYRNIRSFFNYISWNCNAGDFDGMIAVNYNLRHFSLVNQEFGRKMGDIVIKNHYEQIEEMIGSTGIVSRLGGDNFVLICSKSLMKELICYLSEADVPYNDSGDTVTVSCCAGIFVIPDGYRVNMPNDIFEKIISAYNVAKTGGHDSIVFYEESFISGRKKTMQIQQEFPKALRNGEFKVFYQPKVNTFTGELSGAEALCRWIKDGRTVPPAEFIPILEQTSDICRLDLYMLDLVCGDIKRWLDDGRKVVRISVNLSRKHIMNSRLLENIMEIVNRHGIPHEYIEIELTETTADVEFRDLKRIVTGLQAENIFTSVDDFGMGYSSLNLIRAIPWNVLKVDRSFLPLDEENSQSARNIMFKYVVAMARELGLECIAEGVETQTQLEVLRENNCELAQGFFFDRPLPVSEFEKRLSMQKYEI